jgi:hypothetical protein
MLSVVITLGSGGGPGLARSQHGRVVKHTPVNIHTQTHPRMRTNSQNIVHTPTNTLVRTLERQ